MNHKRVSKWDNVKCLLIFLVVIGHFANQFTDAYEPMRMIAIFIYSFHMPLFIFMAGLLSGKLEKNAVFCWDKPIFYMMIGYLLKIITFAIKTVYGQDPVFEWFGDDKLPWYMFAMAGFMVLNYSLRNVSAKVVLPVSLVLACGAGYISWIGSFLYISRILVFFPFYYLGYIIDPAALRRVTQRTEAKIMSVGMLAAAVYISVSRIETAYPWIRMFTGRNAYDLIHIEDCGFEHRMVFYLLALAMGFAIITLVPERENALAGKIGQRTLQIYFWHRMILYVIIYSGLADMIREVLPSAWMAVYFIMAAALCGILSWQPFALPLTMLKNIQICGIRELRHAQLLYQYYRIRRSFRKRSRIRLS